MNKIFTQIALFFIFSCASVFAQDAASIFKDRVNSTVAIITADKDGTPIGQGSGFFIGRNLVATSHHVVAGADQAIIQMFDGSRYDVSGYVADDADNDVVILKVDYDDGQAIEVASDSPQIGEHVYVISTPKGLTASISDGLISGRRGDYEKGETEVFQFTAPVSPGSSGGVVLDKDGYFIGIVRSQFDVGQNLNFAVHAAYIKLLEQNKGFKRPLSALPSQEEEKKVTKREAVKEEDTIVPPAHKPSPPSSTKDTNPCAGNLQQYQEDALNKVYELEGYMMKVANKQTYAIDVRNAIDLAVKLFTSEDRTVEVSSTKRTTKNPYPIREYLNRIRAMPYDNVRVSWSNISYISNLRKGMDGNYYGIISFDQYFEGIKDGKAIYRDRTRKNVEVVLKSQNIYKDGQEIPYCDIFLSDIGVVSTQ